MNFKINLLMNIGEYFKMKKYIIMVGIKITCIYILYKMNII